MNKWIVAGAVALAVFVLVKKAKADPASPAYVLNPQNWKTLPGYIAAQQGRVVA